MFNLKKQKNMKKLFVPFGFVALLLVMASFTNVKVNVVSGNVVLADGFVKIVNDTPNKVEIHTGSGYTTLYPRGGSTSVKCEEGRKISFADGGKKGKTIFTINSNMCGKTVKLSEYL
jgi:hypothetical protein